eukprot:gene9815-18386_t
MRHGHVCIACANENILKGSLTLISSSVTLRQS